MKFTEGMWRLREGVRVDWMANIERLAVSEEAKTVDILLNKKQTDRIDILNSATVSAHVTSPSEGIIGVELIHWAGQLNKGPYYPIGASADQSHVSIKEEKGKGVAYTSGPLRLDVDTTLNETTFKFSSSSKGKLTGHSHRSIAYVSDMTTDKTNWDHGMYLDHEGYMLAELDLGVSESLYGLGERFGPLVKNGQSIDVWNEDAPSSHLAYKNVPFYMSSNGYGVFINHPGRVSLELQTEISTRVNISVPGQRLKYFIVYGETPKEVLKRYIGLTGQPALVPAWSYNLWLTTSFTTSYDEQTVTSFLDGFRDRNLPLGVFHFDCFWMKSYQWCDFQFDSDMFPDAAGYLKRIKERGLKISVWINPYVGQASPLFEEGAEKGYFIKRTDGSVWQWDLWQAGNAVVDFTNPEACKWFTDHLRRLMDMGVDSFKTDFGERIPFINVKYHDGSDPMHMHNYYALLYNKVVYEAMKERQGESQSIVFARSTAPGGQAYPVHWGGDCESTFEAMAESLRGGLSLMLCGYIFWASDIGGFKGTPPPALYKRWVQFGLWSTHSRLHGSRSYRVPWIYGEDCCDVLRDCVKRKILLTPYLLQEAIVGHREGTPIMRAMFLEFPDDLNTYPIGTQYMFGSNLLVAPVFNEEGTVTFYIPRDPTNDGNEGAKWRSWFDHERTYEPGHWYTETHGFDTMPVIIRPGSVTATNPKLNDPEGDPLDGIELIVNGGITTEVMVEVVNPKVTHEVIKTITLSPDLVCDDPSVKVVNLG